jgi:hypothetical protein
MEQSNIISRCLAQPLFIPTHCSCFPLCPGMMIMQDCERKAAGRFLVKLRQDHPHLKCVVLEDELSSNSPHITNLIDHNMRFILEAKPGDHANLFAQLDRAPSQTVKQLNVPKPSRARRGLHIHTDL